ncbi:MAG: glycosyltransferase family 2 protein, partial [Acidimicrobiales bacterium]
RVRAFERSLYQGQASMEAARFFTREAFEALGGFDEELAAAEDWDLGIRARALARIGRTNAGIDHDEGRLTYRDACRKKGHYAVGVKRFVQKHGRQALATGLDRPWLRRPWLLAWPSPFLGAGLLALKVGETTAMTAKLSRELIHREPWE